MSDYILSCSSTVDLTKEQMDNRDLKFVCFHFSLNDKEYPDDMGKSLSVEELFRQMIDGADTKTSQVTVEEYIEFFENLLQEKKDILHIEFW